MKAVVSLAAPDFCVIHRAASLLFWGSGPIALMDWQADDLDQCYRAEPAKIDRKK